MTKAKKILALIISLMLVFGMVLVFGSCGGGENNTQDSTQDSTHDSTPGGDNPGTGDVKMVKVTFVMGEGKENVIVEIEKGTSVGSLLIPEAPTFDGYKVKWESVELKNLQEDITVNFEKTPIDYRVDYALAGGTNNPDNPVLYTVEDRYELKAPTHQTGTFAGWYTDEAFTNKVTAIEAGNTGEIKLYARWSFPITYEPAIMMGNNNNPATYMLGENLVLNPAPSFDGFDFAGWFLENIYFTEVTTTEGRTGPLTLYAKYEAKKYTINYHLDGGKNNKDNPATYTSNDTVTFKAPSKNGFAFVGWYSDSNFENEITGIKKGSSGIKDVFARWKSLEELIDGNKETGLNINSIVSLGFDEQAFVEKLVVTTGTENPLTKFIVRGYRGETLIYSKEVTADVTEITVDINKTIDKLELSPIEGAYVAEIEYVLGEAQTSCDYTETNIAKDATFTYANAAEFWCLDFSALVDGKKNHGTSSPKGYNYSIFMTFEEESYFTKILLVCNGKGTLSQRGENFSDVVYNNPQITVRMYNIVGDVVYDSGAVDTSQMEELIVEPNVTASKIEFVILGNGGREGSEFLWEVETIIAEGSHVYDIVESTVPNCVSKGSATYNCPCGTTTTVELAKVPYHTWSEGETTIQPTDTTNGVIKYTCIVCGETKEEGVPATSHNWDSGVVIAPSCITGGYTVYTCTDDGCKMTYTNSFTYPTGHIYVDGTVTKRPTLDEFGEIEYKCVNDGCEEVKVERIRKTSYLENVFKLSMENVKEINASFNEDLKNNIIDGNDNSYWRGKTGETLEIIFDREYIVTSAEFRISSNWNSIRIQFFKENKSFDSTQEESAANPKWTEVAKFENGGFQPSDNKVVMTDKLGEGTGISRVLLTSVFDKCTDGAPNNNWAGIVYYEMSFMAHKCEFIEADFVKDENYIDATCTEDGSCNAVCVVCKQTVKVKLDKETYGHNYGELVVEETPDCNTTGKGYYICQETECGYKHEVEIEKTRNHSFTVGEIVFAPGCESIGIGKMHCEICGAAGYEYPIPQTGVCVFEDKDACIYCGKEKE